MRERELFSIYIQNLDKDDFSQLHEKHATRMGFLLVVVRTCAPIKRIATQA
jgi:hypothetical protein